MYRPKGTLCADIKNSAEVSFSTLAKNVLVSDMLALEEEIAMSAVRVHSQSTKYAKRMNID